MNGPAPPGNANAGLANRRREKLIDVPRAYHAPSGIQGEVVWAGWLTEASRLFSLYWLSGNLKHFHAFFRHIDAMRSYAGARK